MAIILSPIVIAITKNEDFDDFEDMTEPYA